MAVELFEQEASIFARYLLVPSKMLRKEVKKLKHIDDKGLAALAKTFQVEQWVIVARLADEKLLRL